jgi:hypothetical protein
MTSDGRPEPTIRFAQDALMCTADRIVNCDGALVRSNRDRHGRMTVVCSFMDGVTVLGALPPSVHTGAGLTISPDDARKLAETLLQAASRAAAGEEDPMP